MTTILPFDPVFYFTITYYYPHDFYTIEERILQQIGEYFIIEKIEEEFGDINYESPTLDNMMKEFYHRDCFTNIHCKEGFMLSVKLFSQESEQNTFENARTFRTNSISIRVKNKHNWKEVKQCYLIFRTLFDSPGIVDNTWSYKFPGKGIVANYMNSLTYEELDEIIALEEYATKKLHQNRLLKNVIYNNKHSIDFEKIDLELPNKELIISLRFFDCNLSFWPSILFECENLINIDLYNNHIQQCDPRIKNLTKLKSIFLKNNPILLDAEQMLILRSMLPKNCIIED
jgi:hypothetical protein